MLFVISLTSMNNLILNIFIGTASGVITSLIVYLIYKLKQHIFDPWLENRLYKGVILEGVWNGTRVTPKSHEKTVLNLCDELSLHLELKQRGYDISGIFSAESRFAKSKEGDDHEQASKYINLYNIKGHVHDSYVVLEYCPISRKRTGLGTFVMQVKDGGKIMQGSISFVEEGNMEVMSLDGATLFRSGDE